MRYTGQDLYEMWARCMEAEGVDVDAWEHCEGAECGAWKEMALEINLASPGPA